MLPGEGSDIVNFIEDLPAIQSIFKSWHRSLTLADKTYCAVGLKSARRIRLPTCHVGAIREAGLNENEKHRNCDSTLKQHPSRTARGFTQFLSPVS
jgi:hypothetical protein